MSHDTEFWSRIREQLGKEAAAADPAEAGRASRRRWRMVERVLWTLGTGGGVAALWWAAGFDFSVRRPELAYALVTVIFAAGWTWFAPWWSDWRGDR